MTTATATIYSATNEVLWTGPLKVYARQTTTAAYHHKELRKAAFCLVGSFRAEIVRENGLTNHFYYKAGEFFHSDKQPVPPTTKGLDVTATVLDRKAITAAAKKVTAKPAQRNSRTTVLRGKKAQAAATPARFYIVFNNEVIEAVELSDFAAAQAYADQRYAQRCLVVLESSYLQDGKKLPKSGKALVARQAAARAAASGASKAIIPAETKVTPSKVPAVKTAKPAAAKKTPAAPKGVLSEAMLAELLACVAGRITPTKLGSCMRMHLKMRGMLSDSKAGTPTDAGRKTAEPHITATLTSLVKKAGKKEQKIFAAKGAK